jgi:hypothetical protein
MNAIIDKPLKGAYETAYKTTNDFKIRLGSNEHLDFISDLRPLHKEFIFSLENFSNTFAKYFPTEKEERELMLGKIKELMNLVEFVRKTYEENDLTNKSFKNFINNLYIQSNDLLEFIYDLSNNESIWNDEELIF